MAFQPIIYTFGASEYLNSVFQSMSMLFDFNHNTAMLWLYRIAGAIGIITIVIKAYAARGSDGSAASIDWGWFIMFSILFLAVIVPKTDVRIEDIMKKKTYVVTNAPWALSIFGWLTSSVGYGITRIYEDSLGGGMNPVETYSGNGVAFGSRYYNTLTGIRTFTPVKMEYWVEPFLVECFIPAVSGPYNPKISGIDKSDFYNSPDLRATIKRINAKFLDNRYVSGQQGATWTCNELRDKFIDSMDSDSMSTLILTGLSQATVQDLDAAYLKIATDVNSNSLKQAWVINALYASVEAQSSRLGDTATSAALYNAQAQFQTISSWRQASVMASTSMVWLHIVAECMIYALWTLCTFLFLLPGGIKGIMVYIKLLVWVQIWPIFYAILNSIIAVYATSKTSALALQYAGLTMSNFYQISDLNGGIVTTAGYLSTMIPVMAWMFLQGAGAAVSQIAGAISASGKMAAERAGMEESVGTMQINKVTVKDTNFAGSETTGAQTNKQISDTGTVTTVGSNTTVQSSAMNNKLPVNVDYSKIAQQQIQNAKSAIHSEMGNQAKTWQNLASTLHNAAVTNSGGKTDASSDGFNDNNGINKLQQLVQKVADNYQQQAYADASVSAGTPSVLPLSASAKVGTKVAKGKSEEYATSDNQGLNQALSDLGNYIKGHQTGTTGVIGDSFNQVQGLLKQSSKTVSDALNLSKVESNVNSQGDSIKVSGDNAFVQHLLQNGYTAESINNMAQNNLGQLNHLAQDFAQNVFVPKILGDMSNYSTDKIDDKAVQQAINANASQYANNGANGGKIKADAGKIIQEATDANTQQEIVLEGGLNADRNKLRKELQNRIPPKRTSNKINPNAYKSNAVQLAQQGKVKPYNVK